MRTEHVGGRGRHKPHSNDKAGHGPSQRPCGQHGKWAAWSLLLCLGPFQAPVAEGAASPMSSRASAHGPGWSCDDSSLSVCGWLPTCHLQPCLPQLDPGKSPSFLPPGHLPGDAQERPEILFTRPWGGTRESCEVFPEEPRGSQPQVPEAPGRRAKGNGLKPTSSPLIQEVQPGAHSPASRFQNVPAKTELKDEW